MRTFIENGSIYWRFNLYTIIGQYYCNNNFNKILRMNISFSLQTTYIKLKFSRTISHIHRKNPLQMHHLKILSTKRKLLPIALNTNRDRNSPNRMTTFLSGKYGRSLLYMSKCPPFRASSRLFNGSLFHITNATRDKWYICS